MKKKATTVELKWEEEEEEEEEDEEIKVASDSDDEYDGLPSDPHHHADEPHSWQTLFYWWLAVHAVLVFNTPFSYVVVGLKGDVSKLFWKAGVGVVAVCVASYYLTTPRRDPHLWKAAAVRTGLFWGLLSALLEVGWYYAVCGGELERWQPLLFAPLLLAELIAPLFFGWWLNEETAGTTAPSRRVFRAFEHQPRRPSSSSTTSTTGWRSF
ncbi:hypothetical protein QOT17_021819 [Balamuthia mandrillaris]